MEVQSVAKFISTVRCFIIVAAKQLNTAKQQIKLKREVPQSKKWGGCWPPDDQAPC